MEQSKMEKELCRFSLNIKDLNKSYADNLYFLKNIKSFFKYLFLGSISEILIIPICFLMYLSLLFSIPLLLLIFVSLIYNIKMLTFAYRIMKDANI